MLIWGYYGAENFGDDLIFNSLFHLINEGQNDYQLFYTVKDKNAAYNIDAEPIEFFTKRKSNKALNFLSNIKHVFATVKKMDAIIIGGGTQYFEIKERKPISILLKYIACKRIQSHGGKFINAGVGIGEIKTKLGKYCLKWIFNRADYSFVRDEKSKRTLENIGVQSDKVDLGMDLSFYHQEKLQLVESTKSNIQIGLNFFDFYNYIEKNSDKRLKLLNSVKAFIETVKTQFKADIHLFALQKGIGGRDYEFMQKLNTNCELHFYKEDQPKFMSLMTSMDFNIGLRYHFALVSLQYGIPTIGINYQPKVKRELTKFGLDEYVLEMEEVDENSLYSLFLKMTQNKGLISEQISQKNNQIKQNLNLQKFKDVCNQL